MSGKDKHSLPSELNGIVERLETERPRPTDFELDRIKLRAITGAAKPVRSSRPGKGFWRSGRVASVALATVLMAGGGAVVAKTGGPSSAASTTSSSSSQYCPPSSPGGGKPKPPPGPQKCGKP